MTAVQVIFLIVGPLAGACLGSYAATTAVRLARSEQAVAGRSRCDACGVALGFARSTPVISYISLGGACADCGGRIDPIHLVGEIGAAAVVLAALLIAPPLTAALLAGLGLLLLTAALIDAKTQRLPDGLTLAIAVLAALLAAQRSMTDLAVGAVAAALTFAVFEAIRRGFLASQGKPGLGFGDVKLAAVLALWLGLTMPWAMAAASVLGLIAMAVVRPANGRLSFGPAIALAAFAVGLIREAGAWPGLV
jgi:leader peptidase (prepilin peptidase)/N-methyltransferase